MTGFADKGESYAVRWVNSSTTLTSMYGKPTTEFEKLFHNACLEVINRGGICLASKLPYDNNESKTYTYCDYSVDSTVHSISSYSGTLSSICKYVDSNLTSFIEISSTGKSGKIDLDTFDNLKVGNSGSLLKTQSGNGVIRIVDISRSRLQRADFNCVSSVSLASGSPQWTNECLGLFPVIVTPPNALYWQYLSIKDNEHVISDGNDVCLSDFNAVEELTCIKPDMIDAAYKKSTNLSARFDNELYHPASSLKSEETISKFSAQLFPSIPYASAQHLNT